MINLDDVLKLGAKFNSQTTIAESVELYRGVLNTPDGDVVEVGSASGGTTIVLVKAAGQVGKKVYSIDTYPEDLTGIATHYVEGFNEQAKKEFRENLLTGEYNVEQFNVDVQHCLDRLPINLSVVFIDGLHELSFAIAEFNLLFPRVVAGGRIYIHDTNWTIGQLTQSEENGLSRIWNIVDKNLFTEIYSIDSMFCGRKRG